MKRIALVPTRKLAEQLRRQLRSRGIRAYVRCIVAGTLRSQFSVFTNEKGA